ncbi:hypothetical protein [Mycolicibacterium sediminis]|uniref:Uncharacterized protein n=1 Tax=Mycolicibacterium sediminis TaxID=1286180 RepID=A0A7I7QTV9_9MYCO|nr:hypothetical protein [Mycolicibacterium sediminis]BBY29430.1 hypothetical protein MSEDJ_35260 [Mycolicibacterium sediminis]
MNLRPVRRPVDGDVDATFGPQYETADGTVVIPVSNPVGIFVVKDGRSSWRPATDDTRIALAGILVGLVATSLLGVTMLRRPPWPDLYGEVSKRI